MLNNGNFTFYCRTKIGFGLNALEHLPFDLDGMGSQKPLVLMDKQALLGGCKKPLVRAFKESGMTLGICPPIHQIDDTRGSKTQGDIETLRPLYQIYTDKGFDAIIVLGTGQVVDMAKALNIAVTLGPDTLNALLKTGKENQINQPLNPFVYIPTEMGTGMETRALARFNNTNIHSALLAPDLTIIDPDILTDPAILKKNAALPLINAGLINASLINASLTCLSVCCEAHVLSGNPVARAYADTGIGLIMENFLPLIKYFFTPGVSINRLDKKKIKRHHTRLTHAAVITGILLTNYKPQVCFQLGKQLSRHLALPPGQAMAMLLPGVLDILTVNRSDLGTLFRPLGGSEKFARVPAFQRPGLAIQKIQGLVNELYQISLGAIPRILGDNRLDPAAPDLIRALFSAGFPAQLPGITPQQTRTILAYTLEPPNRVLNQTQVGLA